MLKGKIPLTFGPACTVIIFLGSYFGHLCGRAHDRIQLQLVFYAFFAYKLPTRKLD